MKNNWQNPVAKNFTPQLPFHENNFPLKWKTTDSMPF
jgi:hypothetical protein